MAVLEHGYTGGLTEIKLQADVSFDIWRNHARKLLTQNTPPEAVCWTIGGEQSSLDLFDSFERKEKPHGSHIKIAPDLLNLLRTALMHSADDRFQVAYSLLYRTMKQPRLHRNPADAQVIKLNGYVKSVRRDIHKMHAFVRFRKVGESNGREQFVAWFEPDHYIVEATAPFFRNRFNGMDWLIITPRSSIAWDGTNVAVGPGGAKSDAPTDDKLEEEWRVYYANIFNPARLKIKAMKSEMPVKYWKNLPEAELIEPLITKASGRIQVMIDDCNVNDLPVVHIKDPVTTSDTKFENLNELYKALTANDKKPSENFSDKIVCGTGPLNASMMFIGEQPGDEEDRQGTPFAGPAGQLLNSALKTLGINQTEAFLTNAVKRFKFITRGNRRVHQTPTISDIEHYRWWLSQEIALVKPEIIVALGQRQRAHCLVSRSQFPVYAARL